MQKPPGWPDSRLPVELVKQLRDELMLTTFIETGTKTGDTAAVAAAIFPRVVTIELSDYQARLAAAYLHGIPNIELVIGDSAVKLPRLLAPRQERICFWLDAHWSGEQTAHNGLECPLIAELQTIVGYPQEHVILIDDARLFEASDQQDSQMFADWSQWGQNADHWPTTAQLRKLLVDYHFRMLPDIDIFLAIPSRCLVSDGNR